MKDDVSWLNDTVFTIRFFAALESLGLKVEIHVEISKNCTDRKQQQIEEYQFFEDSEGLLSVIGK